MPYTTTNLPPAITDTPDCTLTYVWAAAGTYYGYTNVKTVQYEFPKKGNYSALTDSAIGQEITNAALEIHGQLARLYSMPYLGSDAAVLQTLGDINTKLAVANLIDRAFSGSEPNEPSVQSAEWRSWGELILEDLKTGVIQWGSPFNDVVIMAEKPLYPLSAGISVMPSPNTVDPNGQPVFTMGRFVYRRDSAI